MIQFITPVPPENLWWHRAILERWIDGDSCVLSELDRGFNEFRKGARVRLAKIETPERFSDAGMAATQFVRDLVPDGSEILIYSHKDSTGKYARIVAEIIYSGININQALIDSGHAIIPDYAR